ncbi:MAG: hypothetical protein AAF741_16325 [Bacteroidota bacterium]
MTPILRFQKNIFYARGASGLRDHAERGFSGFRLCFLVVLSVVFTESLFAQNAFEDNAAYLEAIGAIPVQFEITSLGESLEPIEQYLIKRAETEYIVGSEVRGGMGFESWKLSIVTKKPILRPEDRSDFLNGTRFKVQFYDENDEFIGLRYLGWRGVRRFAESKDKIYYEIDLRLFPLLMLKDAKRIDIVRRRPIRN